MRRPFLDERDFMGECLTLYGYYKKGMLPYSGGVNGQPAKLIDAFHVIDSALSDAQEERDNNEKRKAVGRERSKQAASNRGGGRPTPGRN